jgi:hypothetical protein
MKKNIAKLINIDKIKYIIEFWHSGQENGETKLV